MSSLRSDVRFIAKTLGKAIRQILGETFRIIADTLLYRKQEPIEAPPSPAPVAPPVNVEKSTTSSRKSKAPQRQTLSHEPPPVLVELPEKPPKVRNRSGYLAKEHGSYKVAAIGILRVFLHDQEANHRLSVPELHKLLNKTSTDSTIRTACKTMVEDQIFDTVHEEGARSAVYWVKNVDAACNHLTYLESVTPILPTSEESGEPETSLN